MAYTSAQIRQSLKLKKEIDQKSGILTDDIKKENRYLRFYFYRLRLNSDDINFCIDQTANRYSLPIKLVSHICSDIIEELNLYDGIINGIEID